MFYFFFLIHLFFVNCFKQIMKIMKNRICHLFNIKYPIIQGGNGLVQRVEAGFCRK